MRGRHGVCFLRVFAQIETVVGRGAGCGDRPKVAEADSALLFRRFIMTGRKGCVKPRAPAPPRHAETKASFLRILGKSAEERQHPMARPPMTPELISRNMTRTTEDGRKMPVAIRFGTPAITPASPPDVTPYYYCPIQLSGLDDDAIYPIYGIDALHALTLALCFAGTLLATSRHANTIDDWDTASNYGFPFPSLPAASAAGGNQDAEAPAAAPRGNQNPAAAYPV